MVFVVLKNDLNVKDGVILEIENEFLKIVENVDFSELDFENPSNEKENDRLIQNIILENDFELITLFDLHNYSIFNYGVLDTISDIKKLKNGNYKTTFERKRYCNNFLGFVQNRIKNFESSDYYQKYGYKQHLTLIECNIELFKPNVKYVRFPIKDFNSYTLYIKEFF